LEDAELAGKYVRNDISTFDVEKESDEEGQDVEKEENDPNSRSDEVTN
jgi:hypothetical protein